MKSGESKRSTTTFCLFARSPLSTPSITTKPLVSSLSLSLFLSLSLSSDQFTSAALLRLFFRVPYAQAADLRVRRRRRSVVLTAPSLQTRGARSRLQPRLDLGLLPLAGPLLLGTDPREVGDSSSSGPCSEVLFFFFQGRGRGRKASECLRTINTSQACLSFSLFLSFPLYLYLSKTKQTHARIPGCELL